MIKNLIAGPCPSVPALLLKNKTFASQQVPGFGYLNVCGREIILKCKQAEIFNIAEYHTTAFQKSK